MREFVCGYQTLLTCGGEIVGFAIFLLVCLLALALWLHGLWDERQMRKRTPHPECCSTPLRCDGEAQCWRVPSCAKTRNPVDTQR